VIKNKKVTEGRKKKKKLSRLEMFFCLCLYEEANDKKRGFFEFGFGWGEEKKFYKTKGAERGNTKYPKSIFFLPLFPSQKNKQKNQTKTN
jgi:hypothetical protein